MYNIQRAIRDAMRDFTEEESRQSFQGWKVRLKECVASGGNYLKGTALKYKDFRIKAL